MDDTEAPPSESDAIEEALAHLVAARMLLAPVALLRRRCEDNTRRMRQVRAQKKRGAAQTPPEDLPAA